MLNRIANLEGVTILNHEKSLKVRGGISYAQDFNSARSNKDKGQFTASAAQDFNSARSNKDKGQFIVDGDITITADSISESLYIGIL